MNLRFLQHWFSFQIILQNTVTSWAWLRASHDFVSDAGEHLQIVHASTITFPNWVEENLQLLPVTHTVCVYEWPEMVRNYKRNDEIANSINSHVLRYHSWCRMVIVHAVLDVLSKCMLHCQWICMFGWIYQASLGLFASSSSQYTSKKLEQNCYQWDFLK